MRILFDSTFSVASGKQSGIERVVRSLLKEAKKPVENNADLQDNEVVEPVFIHDGGVYKLCEEAGKEFTEVANFQADCLRAIPFAYGILAKAICQVVRVGRVRRWLLPSPGHMGIFKPWYKRKLARAFLAASQRSERVHIDSNDILWLPDAYWAASGIWPALNAAKEAGAYIGCLVFDLIPLQDVDTGEVDGSRNENFFRYLEFVVANADGILTISNTVKRQLEEFIALQWPNRSVSQSVNVIPMGAEIQLTTGEVRSQLSAFFEENLSHQPYLCLGTFEPRKNQALVLEAFELLWPTCPNLRLCFIGRVGWQCETIVEKLRTHPELGRRLFVCHNASDAEVSYCYRNCRAFLTASRQEGFGLPIVEAQWHRKPVIASNIPIHREVAGDACHYFHLDSPSGLAGVVSDLELRLIVHSPTPLSDLTMTTWEQSWAACRAELVEGYKVKRS